MKSITVTNETTFEFNLRFDMETGEIESCTQIVYTCENCGVEVHESLGYCEEHPSATVNSTIENIELVETPQNIGENADTDVIFFGHLSKNYRFSFGLQSKEGRVRIQDLDGEQLSGSAEWALLDKVPKPIAEYAIAVPS